MDKTKFSLLATILALSIVILLFVIIFVIKLLKYNRVFKAVNIVVKNNLFCEPQEGLCELKVNNALTQPENFTATFSYDLARYCSDLIARVALLFYDKKGLIDLVMPRDIQNIKSLTFNKKIIGFVGKSTNTKTAWIAFRGTAHDTEWQQDFNFTQSEFQTQEKDAQEPFTIKDGHIMSCHKGFLNVFSEFKNDMISAIESIRPDDIVITGHSLGASLATLASLHLSPSYNVYTYLFASPRVCDFIPDVNMVLFRLNNSTDMITTLPLSVMPNFKDKDRPFYYTHGGVSMEFTTNRHSLTNNHLLSVYIDALDNKSMRSCLL
jgi:hypothetical protein